MEQEREQIEGQQSRRQMLFAVPEVVLEVVPFGLQGIVVLVFDLPPTAACLDQLLDVFEGDLMIGNEGILSSYLAAMVGHREACPVDLDGVLLGPEIDLIEVAVGEPLAGFAGPLLTADVSYVAELLVEFYVFV